MRLLIAFIFCLLIVNTSFGQKKRNDYKDQAEALFWGPEDEYKDIYEIPEKWNNESVVVIFQKVYYKYDKFSQEGQTYDGIRRRVKLLDQVAVEEFSEITIANPYDERMSKRKIHDFSMVAIKIYKPDGTVNEVNLDEAIVIDDDGESTEKIAIPDLVPGDIIDYYFFSRDEFIIGKSHRFTPVVSTLNDVYPVMQQEVVLEFDQGMYFKIQSYNGAPKFKYMGEVSSNVDQFIMVDGERDKIEDLRWNYAYQELPYIKFQAHVLQLTSFKDVRYYNLLGEKGELFEGFNTAELTERIQMLNHQSNIKLYGKKIKKTRKKDDSISDKKLIKDKYEGMLYSTVLQFIQPITLYQEGLIYYIPGLSSVSFPDSYYMARHMIDYCIAAGLDCQLVAATSRDFSKLDDVLFNAEFEYMVKINFDDETMYLPMWTVYNNYGEIPKMLEGSEVLLLDFDLKGKIIGGSKNILPTTDYNENSASHDIKLDLSDLTSDVYTVERMSTLTGHAMDYLQDKLLTQGQYIDQIKDYYDKPLYTEGLGYSESDREIKTKYKELTEQEFEDSKKLAEDIIGNDVEYEITEYNSLDILSTGLFDQEEFIMNQIYSIDPSFLKRAGKNYLIPVGSLIDGQVAIKEDELEREENIYMPYPRSYENTIHIAIPEGYTVEGIDQLVFNVVNSTGGFTSEASFENQELVVSTKKWYINNYEPSENWSQMVEFLEAAYQFTQAKTLMKLVE